jgi:antitoxin ParD1/3/4
MNEAVKLKPELTAFIEEAIASGEYGSREAVVEEAVREWHERRQNHGYALAELRRLAQEGLDSGPGRYQSMDEIKSEARRRLEQRRQV